MHETTLCRAIEARQLIAFRYDTDSGMRVIEPHLLGWDDDGELKLLAWFVSGASKSGSRVHWRTFKVSGMSGVRALEATFPGMRATKDVPKHGINRVRCVVAGWR